MDAIRLLKEDHRKVKQLFEEEDQLEEKSEFDRRKELFQKIKHELTVHSEIEKSVFYPFFSEDDQLKGLIEGFYDDHQEVEDLLDEIGGIDSPVAFEDRLGELIQSVNVHIAEEEQKLFPKIEKGCSSDQLDTLGGKLEEAKQSAEKKAA